MGSSIHQASPRERAHLSTTWSSLHRSLLYVGYAGDKGDRKSTTGYCTYIGGNLVTW